MAKHWFKAIIASTVVAAGFAARELTTSTWRFAIYLVAVVVVFSQNAWDFRPDKRIDKIRRADMDRRLGAMFSAAQSAVRAGQRLPFRVNVMVWRWRWFRPALCMVYSYAMRPTDDDYGMIWGWPSGLCWEVYRTGRAGFAQRAADGFRMNRRQKEATRHVCAVLSLPIRSAHAKDGDLLPRKSIAVLNVDAITEAAAQELQLYWDEITKTHSHELIALADYAGLYC